MINLHLTILTFAPKSKPRLKLRLPHLITTLQQSEFPGDVTVVDDASNDPEHIEYLESLSGINVVRRGVRGGISRAKNTCLRVLRESDFTFGFIMEDDMEVSENWWRPYLRLHLQTGIHHFSWASDKYFSSMRKFPAKRKDRSLVRCSRLNGSMLTVTPRQIAKVGGFKVMPKKWGREHIHYTDRCVRARFAPFYVDVPKSNRLMRLGPYSKYSFITTMAARRACNHANSAAARSRRMHEPIRE